MKEEPLYSDDQYKEIFEETLNKLMRVMQEQTELYYPKGMKGYESIHFFTHTASNFACKGIMSIIHSSDANKAVKITLRDSIIKTVVQDILDAIKLNEDNL